MHLEIGEAEAVYKLMPIFHLKDSNITTIFVPSNMKADRRKFLVKVDLRRISSDMEGVFLEKSSVVDKYYKQPASLEEICLVQFSRMYRPSNATKSKSGDGSEEEEEDSNGEDAQLGSVTREDSGVNNFSSLMTNDPTTTQTTLLSKVIELNKAELVPGEAKLLHLRTFLVVMQTFCQKILTSFSWLNCSTTDPTMIRLSCF